MPKSSEDTGVGGVGEIRTVVLAHCILGRLDPRKQSHLGRLEKKNPADVEESFSFFLCFPRKAHTKSLLSRYIKEDPAKQSGT